MRAAKWRGAGEPRAWTASRFVRFDTGSSSDPQLASQIVVKANGSGDAPTRRATSTTTGVSSTAVVSSDRKTVQRRASTTTSPQSTQTRPSE